MMEHIIKREARLWHKQYLAYKLKDKELKNK